MQSFIEAEKLDVEDLDISSTVDGSTTCDLVDEVLRAKWIEYHNSIANLAVISKRANLSKGGR